MNGPLSASTLLSWCPQIVAVVLFGLLPTTSQAAQPDLSEAGFAKVVRPFLSKHCFACHGPQQQKGERRFDRLNFEIPDDDALVDFQDILDQLNLGEMPPAARPQPTDVDRQLLVDWLTARLESHRAKTKPHSHSSVLRRLNRREYLNTIRDLLKLNMQMFDPTRHFPRDQMREHLDNQGDKLVTSGHLLHAYLQAAGESIDKALGTEAKPASKTWRFTKNFRQQPENDSVHRRVHNFSYLTLYEVVGSDKHEGAYAPLHEFSEGVPHDGYYRIRLRAEAVNRDHPYDKRIFGLDAEEPFRLGIVPGRASEGPLYKPQPVEPLLAEFELADEKRWYETNVWLDQGVSPRFTFLNGPIDVRNLFSRVIRLHPELFPKRVSGIVAARMMAIGQGKLPQVRIHEVEISGPHFPQWPTPSRRALLGSAAAEKLDDNFLTHKKVRQLLARFASLAFRRQVTAEEVDRIMAVYKAREPNVASKRRALSEALQTVLCSPHFLYLQPATGEQVSGMPLANRLSYFLWSAPPDAELIELVERGELIESLPQQVSRMLTDPRSEAFVNGFLDSWLTLRDLGATPPDRGDFRDYYQYDLKSAMLTETRMFFRHLLEDNLSIENFVDSNFTFVNRPLARHYQLPLPKESGFVRVQLTDRRRGGLLGQASVLTVTANGIDTSPVIRGVWMLENILGTPPSPPPPDVEPLDPDVRGAKTIRDQLKKHRSVATCYDCHSKIDPLGFALENFNPIGKWRSSYNRTKIDASGELPDGQKFDNVVGLKKILKQKKILFTRALVSKMLSYSLGRHIGPTDRAAVDRIVHRLEQRGNGLQDLVTLVVTDPIFLAK